MSKKLVAITQIDFAVEPGKPGDALNKVPATKPKIQSIAPETMFTTDDSDEAAELVASGAARYAVPADEKAARASDPVAISRYAPEASAAEADLAAAKTGKGGKAKAATGVAGATTTDTATGRSADETSMV